MPKTWRNTIITLIILTLTSAGLRWNKELVASTKPISVTNDVLAAQINSNFPVAIQVPSNEIHLGQVQNIRVSTVSDSALEILVVLPSGKTSQTIDSTTDKYGQYSFEYSSNDFHDCGQIKIIAVAKNSTQTSEGQASFALSL